MNDPIGATMAFAAQDDSGSGNPDPTMKPSNKSPKGENMPPAGGESMSPANSKQPPRPNEYGAEGATPDDNSAENDR